MRGYSSSAVQGALIHPPSYAPDGQGRYTTPMYFRGVSLLDSYDSFLPSKAGAQRADQRGTERMGEPKLRPSITRETKDAWGIEHGDDRESRERVEDRKCRN